MSLNDGSLPNVSRILQSIQDFFVWLKSFSNTVNNVKTLYAYISAYEVFHNLKNRGVQVRKHAQSLLPGSFVGNLGRNLKQISGRF